MMYIGKKCMSPTEGPSLSHGAIGWVASLDSHIAVCLKTDGHLLDLLGRDADGPIKRDARAG